MQVQSVCSNNGILNIGTVNVDEYRPATGACELPGAPPSTRVCGHPPGGQAGPVFEVPGAVATDKIEPVALLTGAWDGQHYGVQSISMRHIRLQKEIGPRWRRRPDGSLLCPCPP